MSEANSLVAIGVLGAAYSLVGVYFLSTWWIASFRRYLLRKAARRIEFPEDNFRLLPTMRRYALDASDGAIENKGDLEYLRLYSVFLNKYVIDRKRALVDWSSFTSHYLTKDNSTQAVAAHLFSLDERFLNYYLNETGGRSKIMGFMVFSIDESVTRGIVSLPFTFLRETITKALSSLLFAAVKEYQTDFKIDLSRILSSAGAKREYARDNLQKMESST